MNLKHDIYKNWERNKYDLTKAQRDEYRRISEEARTAKSLAQQGKLSRIHEINIPAYNPAEDMPRRKKNGFTSLSLFSGGGGLDLAFDLAGFKHIGSHEIIPICGETIHSNRPDWLVKSGPNEGDVTLIDWRELEQKVDVIHGGPPCQPFSIAGGQQGAGDERDMWPEFIRAVHILKPQAFVAENVLGLLSTKFATYVQTSILDALPDYSILKFELNAADFGVPQIRRRVFFVGFLSKKQSSQFEIPFPTHDWSYMLDQSSQSSLFELCAPTKRTMGAREALGLSPNGFVSLAPTLRSGFTGKRNTTSVLNSAAAQKVWSNLEIWPNGIQKTREAASAYPAKNGHFRMSVKDCGLLQGFPDTWEFCGAVYQQIGQIGNSVCPPVAYQIATRVIQALEFTNAAIPADVIPRHGSR